MSDHLDVNHIVYSVEIAFAIHGNTANTVRNTVSQLLETYQGRINKHANELCANILNSANPLVYFNATKIKLEYLTASGQSEEYNEPDSKSTEQNSSVLS